MQTETKHLTSAISFPLEKRIVRQRQQHLLTDEVAGPIMKIRDTERRKKERKRSSYQDDEGSRVGGVEEESHTMGGTETS